MPTPAGGYGKGTRGTHKDGPFESPTPDAGHMPAKSPETQPDFNSSGKRGVHDSDFSGNKTAEPKELRRNMHEGGWTDEKGEADKTIDMARGFDPRRTHP